VNVSNFAFRDQFARGVVATDIAIANAKGVDEERDDGIESANAQVGPTPVGFRRAASELSGGNPGAGPHVRAYAGGLPFTDFPLSLTSQLLG
jgi:hypothetical protein